MPADVLRNRVFSACCVTVLLISAIFFSSLLYLPQFLEDVLGFSALRAGAIRLPLMGAFALTSFAAGRRCTTAWARRPWSRPGVAFLAVGIFLLSGLDHGSTYASLVPRDDRGRHGRPGSSSRP